MTIVVAAKDPGYGNWIDTDSHAEGDMGAALDQGGLAPDPDVEGSQDLTR